MTIKQISAETLQHDLNTNHPPLLLDVREPHEFEFVHIKESNLVPLNQIPNYITNLDFEQAIVLICHHGMRSQQAAEYMNKAGFINLFNLVGGIDAWAIKCNPTMRRY
ncbi:MAG: rhodanese-like domain-containing protein [Methylococcales bacterium]|nr:rhodanese-like domain-containing protein [Methylococcales bacterium]